MRIAQELPREQDQIGLPRPQDVLGRAQAERA
jgi:hypothetical protein